jgi:hypothetical protein
MAKRIFYHVTAVNRGPVWTATRRVPTVAHHTEPPVPRLCVSCTIAGCLAARLQPAGKQLYVYRTAKPMGSNKPVRTWDQAATGERWLVPPVDLVLDRVIDANLADRVYCAIRLYHQITRANSSIRLRICQVAIAERCLGKMSRWTRRVLDLFELGDPEDYIVERALGIYG